MQLDWITYIKTDENKALSEIYQKYGAECIRFVQSKFSLDRDAAIEIFQLSVIVLYDNVICGKLHSLSGKLKTYLIGISKNKALEYLRTRNLVALDDEYSQISYLVINEEEDMVESQLEAAEVALEELGDPCKSLLTMYYYKRLSMDEISTTMGYSNRDSAKNQKYKCLKRLQSIYFSHTTIDQQI